MSHNLQALKIALFYVWSESGGHWSEERKFGKSLVESEKE